MSGDQPSLVPTLHIGDGVTNPRLSSHVDVAAKPRHTVTIQFAPASQYLEGKDLDKLTKKDSLNLSGNLVAVQGQATPLLKNPAITALPGISQQRSYIQKGESKKVIHFNGNSFNIYNVHDGDVLKFFFSRDALSKYRKTPLWEMAIKCRTFLTVYETPGKIKHDPSARLIQYDEITDTAWFSATLSGSTWKECSPRFSAAEALGIMKNSTISGEILSLVSGIYGGSLTPERDRANVKTGRKFIEGVLTPGGAPVRFIWPSDMGNHNPSNNIDGFDDLLDIPLRVHPLAYAAVFKAAMECGLQSVLFNSSWRPMLGSCGHRQGRGLDIGEIVRAGEKPVGMHFVYSDMTNTEKAAYDAIIRLDEAKARLKDAKDSAAKLGAAEVAYANIAAEMTLSEGEIAAADDGLQETQDRLVAARAVGSKTAGLEADLHKAESRLIAARKKNEAMAKDLKKKKAAYEDALSGKNAISHFEYFLADAERHRAEAVADWERVVADSEPKLLIKFRAALTRNPDVVQLLDPWRMDIKTQDKDSQTSAAQTPPAMDVTKQSTDSQATKGPPINYRHPGLDQQHANHLHITCAYQELKESVETDD